MKKVFDARNGIFYKLLDKSVEKFTVPFGIQAISAEAFKDCTNLREVTIPDSVTDIGSFAFEGCTNLEKISLSKRLDGIAPGTFERCSKLRAINIPDSVKEISTDAFHACSMLSEIKLPDSPERIGSGAFQRCSRLETVIFPKNINIKKIEAGLFFQCSSLKNISIPDTVKTIGAYAFSGCYNLTDLTIPKSVVSIGKNAFEECGMETMIVPDSVKYIGKGAFSRCHDLKNVRIPPSVKVIMPYTFCKCYNLMNVLVDDTLTEIGDFAFYQTAVTYFRIPSSVREIGKSAFEGSKTLTETVIPETTEVIGEKAFFNTNLKSDDDGMVIRNGWLLDYRGSETDIVIPDTVKRIGSVVFPYRTERLEIPDSVVSIDSSAYKETKWFISHPNDPVIVGDGILLYIGCGSDKDTIMPDSVKRIEDYAFNGNGIENKLPRSVVIPSSVREISKHAFEKSLIPLSDFFFLGMKFDGLRCNDVPTALRLSRTMELSEKIDNELKWAAIIVYFLKNGGEAAETYIRNRFFEIAEMLVDKNGADMLRALLESGKFSASQRRIEKLTALAEKKDKPDIAAMLKNFKRAT